MQKFFARYHEVILLTIALVLIFWAVYALRSVLVPFFIGLVAAYILYPAVVWTEKKLPRKGRWMGGKRISLIILIYVIALGVLAVIGYFSIPAIINSATSLINDLPGLVPGIVQKIQDLANLFQQNIPPEISLQVNNYLTNVLASVGNALQTALLTGLSYIPGGVSLALGFASLPVFVFYVLKDAESLQRGALSQLPPWMAVRARDITAILQEVLGRYIRAQLLMGIIIGVVDFIWLSALGVPYAAALALLSGTMELVPVLGPWIGGSVGVLVTLATRPDRVVWVIVGYAAVQILEGAVLSPRVTGGILRINPAFMVVLVVLGAYLAGPWGIVLIVPVTATLIPIYQYVVKTSREAGAISAIEE
jgi:predicted PurR-regulated permease PerM